MPNGGEDLLWKRHQRCDRLLPGDQVWFDNPFFERGRELIFEEYYQQAIREGKSPEEAAASAKATTESLTAGEEGSNVFCLGDKKFVRGASSLSRLCRDSFQRCENENAAAHEQVFTPKILTLTRFQQHMIDDNYTAQACLRANPGDRPARRLQNRVRPFADQPRESLAIAGSALSKPLESLIDAMASRNKPPQLVTAGDATIPLFGEDYDWAEQERVRTAIDAVMRSKSNDSWWRLRAKIGDDRYVLTATRGGVVKNFTVGCACSDMVDGEPMPRLHAHLPLVPGRLPTTFRPEQEYWQTRSAMGSRAHAALCDAGRLVRACDRTVGVGPRNVARQRWSVAHLYGRREGPFRSGDEEGNRRTEPDEEGCVRGGRRALAPRP